MKEQRLTPRQLQSQQTKESIYDAALRMMKKYEYSYLTVRNICDEAGVSTGTFYHHFENKDALLGYHLTRAFNADEVTNELDFDGNLFNEICYIYNKYLDRCLEGGVDFLSNYYSTKNKALDIRDNYSNNALVQNQVAKIILSRIATARDRGYIREDFDDYDIMNDLCVVAKGVIFEWCLNGGQYDIKAYMQRMLIFYLRNVVTEQFITAFGVR